MKVTRYIVPLVLIVTLTMTGVPLLSQQRAYRDGAVDLCDAIVRVGILAEQAVKSGSMHFTMASALTALRVAAELETVITGDDPADATILSARAGLYLPAGTPEQAYYRSLETPVVLCTSFYCSIPPERIERPPRT